MNFRVRSGPDPTRELPRRLFRDRIVPNTSVAARISVQRAPPARLLISAPARRVAGSRETGVDGKDSEPGEPLGEVPCGPFQGFPCDLDRDVSPRLAELFRD